ncbi:hypothetical protein PAHAL_3G067500 [Panicum hallii]|uniref:GDSL esterase/lipase n=1 Tax=Panicum hallii TaxID=206008 RepID=A0A2S3H6W0_9POAL|nr:GDSL esterase/lipase At4g26790-like [Panicum hallii]PAN16538.1 hypothetical protein PAHAL_3G067500 [Panicum hallii]
MFSQCLQLLILFAHLLLSPSAASGGKVSAVIVFGDSTVDPGNNDHILTVVKGDFPPYGRDFDGGVATGRFSNGRLVTDFISEGFGLPSSVPAYLDTSCTIDQLAMGVSFASAGTGLDDLTADISNVIPVRQQLDYFREYKERLAIARGASEADAIIAGALYYFSIGNNDIGVNYFLLPQRRAQFSPPEYAAFLVGIAGAAVREVYRLGGRKIQLAGILPLGCVPAMRTVNLHRPGECMEDFNQFALLFNAELRKAASKLSGELSEARVVYSDMYSLVSTIIANPWKYGFENVARGCCGTGLIEASFLCVLDEPLTCEDTDKYVFFDSVHPTERIYKMEASQMLNTSLAAFL